MAGALIGALRVSLSAETSSFEAGMRRSQRTAATTSTAISKSLGTVKAGLAGFAAAFTVGVFSRAIGNALEYAGSLAEVAQQLGVTAKDLQVFRFAAGQVGVSQEQLETGLSKLTITLGKVAAGAQEPAKALKAIGISADQVKGKNTGDALRLIADGLQKVTDRSQRAAVEVALFGKTGSMLDNLLSGGSTALNELSRAAEKLGIVLSDEEIRHADETADKLRAVKTVLEAQIASTVAKNADSILSLASALGTLAGEITRFLSTNPQLALGIIGGLVGGRVGGLPGAAVGVVGGAILGGKMQRNAADSNMDLGFRTQQMRAAQREFFARRAASQDKGSIISIRHGSGGGGTVEDAKKEFIRQIGLLQGATAAARSGIARTAGGTNIKPFLAPSAPKPKKPKEDHTDEQRLREEMQFNSDLRRANMDVLQARRDLTHSADAQAALDLQMLDLQKEDQDQELTYQVALFKLTKGKQGLSEEQARQLKIQYDQTDALKREQIAQDLAAQKARDKADLQSNAYDLQIEQLQLEGDLAQTASERRNAELRLLEVMKQQEKARLEAVLADTQSSDLAKQEAQARLNALDAIYAGRQRSVMQQTQGPLENYLQGIPHTADQVNEALQNLEVQGIDGLADALAHVGEGWKSMRDIALRTIQDIVSALIKMQIQRMLFSLFSAAAGGGGLGGSLGGAMSLTGSLAGGASVLGSMPLSGAFGALPGLAGGGSIMVGGNTGIDKNLLSLNNMPIARVNYGERINIGNDNSPSMRGGDIRIHAPITINSPVTRETAGQLGRELNARIAQSRAKGF